MNKEQSQFTRWNEIGFSAETTKDGSPTLRIEPQQKLPLVQLNDSSFELRPESMHHSGGAFSESDYIYGEILDEAMKKLLHAEMPIKVLSLGLGLGYNELLTMAYGIQNNVEQRIYLQSFEIVSDLKNAFLAFCLGETLPFEIENTYQCMMRFFEQKFQLPSSQILESLVSAFEEKRWILESDFVNSKIKKNSHVLMYDAFSGKTNQDLWVEEFLIENINLCSENNALFATYACRASLKRALKNCNYQVVVRDGFQGKRNSTQGRRGVFELPTKTTLQTS